MATVKRAVCLLRTWVSLGALALPLVSSAHPGNGIVALTENSVLTGDAVHNGLWRFERNKAAVKVTGGVRFHCHWVTQGLDGKFYAETLSNRGSTWTDTVYRVDPGGTNLSEITSGTEGTFGIFAIGKSSEIIHRSGSRIVAWAWGSDSAFRGAGKVAAGEPSLGDVRAYAWGPGDYLYLADGPRVRRIGADGIAQLVATIGGKVTDALYAGPSNAPCIWGLAVSSRGEVLVTMPSNGYVLLLDLDSSEKVIAHSAEGWAATGVAECGGRIFLLETKTQGNRNYGPRVRMLRPDGVIETLGEAHD